MDCQRMKINNINVLTIIDLFLVDPSDMQKFSIVKLVYVWCGTFMFFQFNNISNKNTKASNRTHEK